MPASGKSVESEFPFGKSPFYSGVASSLSSSFHENYSMGEFKECGVHLVEQLEEHHIHSLTTQGCKKHKRSGKPLHITGMSIAVPSLSDRISYVYSCTKLPSLNRVGGRTFTLHLPLPLTHSLLLPIGGGTTAVGIR